MTWSRKQISILLIILLTSFMGTFSISSMNIALPSIEKDFNINAITLSWIISSFLLASGMLLMPSGRWSDLFGVRRFFKIGIVLFTIASFLCSIAWSGTSLITFRFLEGISAALTNATGSAILVSSFPSQQRGRVLGVLVSGTYMGLSFGPLLGGIITSTWGWPYIFRIAMLLGLTASIISFIYLGKDEVRDKVEIKKLDLRGAAFYMVGLIALVYGASQIKENHGWIYMTLGIGFLITFWILENRTKFPIFNTKLFTQNRLFAFSNLAALINYTATFAIVFFLSLYLQKIQALSAHKTGFILVAQPAVMALFSPIAGRLSDSFQPRYLSSIGMTMCAVGLVSLGFLTENTPTWFIIIILLWEGLGFALFSSPNMNTIMSSVDKTQYGIASGTAATMRVLGQITGITIVSIFFASFFGEQAVEVVDNDIFMKVVTWGFRTFALICFVGIYFSYNRGKIQRQV